MAVASGTADSTQSLQSSSRAATAPSGYGRARVPTSGGCAGTGGAGAGGGGGGVGGAGGGGGGGSGGRPSSQSFATMSSRSPCTRSVPAPQKTRSLPGPV